MAFTHRDKQMEAAGIAPHKHDTVADMTACEAAFEDYLNSGQLGEIEAERRYERYLEDGGAHAEIIAWEHDEDMRRHPLDPQTGYAADERRAAQEEGWMLEQAELQADEREARLNS